MSQLELWLGLPWYALLPAALALGWVAQEVSRAFAVAIGLLDYPDTRKIHERPVPLSGGPGIFLPLFAVYAIWMLLGSPGMAGWPALALGIGFGAIFLTGLLDDLMGVSARKRLVIQATVALLLWSTGFRLDDISLGAWTLHLGLWSLPLTLFWFMGFMNTSNLMDGMDGLCGGMNLIALLALGSLSALTHPLILLVIGTGLVAFLVFNLRRRGKVFLGDSGSLTLGLAVATLALSPPTRMITGGALPGIQVGLALAAYSIGIADVVAAIIRRSRSGAGIFKPDRQHLHHRLLRVGLGVPGAGLVMHGMAGFTVLILAVSVSAPLWLMGLLPFGALVAMFSLTVMQRTRSTQEHADVTRTEQAIVEIARTESLTSTRPARAERTNRAKVRVKIPA